MCMELYLIHIDVDEICAGADKESKVLDLQSSQTPKHRNHSCWPYILYNNALLYGEV